LVNTERDFVTHDFQRLIFMLNLVKEITVDVPLDLTTFLTINPVSNSDIGLFTKFPFNISGMGSILGAGGILLRQFPIAFVDTNPVITCTTTWTITIEG